MDDALSAVDPHVGHALFKDAILGLRNAGKTVSLVTYALHLLPQADYIMTVRDGQVVGQGTYESVMASGSLLEYAEAEKAELEAKVEAKADSDGTEAESTEAEESKKAAGTGKETVSGTSGRPLTTYRASSSSPRSASAEARARMCISRAFVLVR
jgi:ABC-type multidrug transport system ATPase subunit